MRSARATRMTLLLSLPFIDDEPRVPVLLSVVVMPVLLPMPVPALVPTLVPALVSLLRLPSMVAALRPVIDVELSGLTAALPMLAAAGV